MSMCDLVAISRRLVEWCSEERASLLLPRIASPPFASFCVLSLSPCCSHIQSRLKDGFWLEFRVCAVARERCRGEEVNLVALAAIKWTSSQEPAANYYTVLRLKTTSSPAWHIWKETYGK